MGTRRSTEAAGARAGAASGDGWTTRPEELLAAIAESTTVAIFVKDRDGRYRFVNKQLADVWGFPADEILAKTDFQLFPDDVARRLTRNDRRVVRSREPFTTEEEVVFGGESKIYLSTKVPLLDGSGEVWAICGIAAEITDRKRIENALRESEERFRTLADSAPVMIWLCGAQKEFVFFNRTWLEFTGLSLEDALAGRWLDRIHPDDRSVIREWNEALDQRRPFESRFRLRRADGEYRWVLDSGVPRIQPDGSFAGFVGTCLDITDQLRLENALRAHAEFLTESHQRKDEFLAMLGHELRNPMAPLRNVIEFFRSRRDELDGELQRSLDIADRQLSHMKRLVDDLLDVARITRGRIQLERAPMPLQRAIESAVEAARPFLAEQGVQLELHMPSESLVVEGDEVRLAQVLSNLLDNAGKYTPEGGRVTIAVRSGSGWVEVAVRDTGVGIDPERLDDVFELFQQTGADVDRDHGGLGLGLPLVRTLVAMHGGTVVAESEGRGRGSTFRVRLPKLESAPRRESVDPARANPAPGRRVLVVDDNADSADTLSWLLEREGHDIATAYDGEQALEQVDRFRPEVVLLDIGLPRLDGYQVARRIRARQEPQPLLVALTGYGQESAVEKGVESGFDHHLLKPVDPTTLRELLAGRGRDPEA